HPVADPQDGDARVEDLRSDDGSPRAVDGIRASREHNSERVAPADLVEADVERLDLAKDGHLADTPRDELGVLRAEVENEDAAPLHGFSIRGTTLPGSPGVRGRPLALNRSPACGPS